MKTAESSAEVRGAYFSWEPRGEAIAVDFHVNIIRRLERDAVRAGLNTTAGVLLGRIEAGHLIVEAAEAVTTETGTPNSPFTDLRKVEPIVNRWGLGKKRISVIGLYRSAGQTGSALSKDDCAALCATALKSTDGSIASAGSRYTPSDQIRGGEIADERSMQLFLLIACCPDQLPAATVYLTKGGAVLGEVSLMKFKDAEVSNQQLPKKREIPVAPLLRHQVKVDFQERTDLPINKIGINLSKKWRWVLALAAIVVVGSLIIGRQRQAHFLPGRQAANEKHLGLRVQRSGNDWELRWDQDASTLPTAGTGHLRISDGPIHKELELAPSELRRGRIIYTPVTDDVSMELEVESPESGKPLSESVRIVAGLLPARENQAAMGARLQDFPGNTLRRLRTPGSPATPAVTASLQQEMPPKNTAVFPHNEQSPKAQGAVERTNKHEDDRNAAKNTEVPGQPFLPFSEQAAFLSAPQTLVQLSSPRVPPGGRIEPAQLIARSDPIYPQLAKREQISGNVEVNFKISASGDVRDVVAKGPPMLTQAAMEAVRKWHYVPARLNGVSTEARATTIITFKLN